MGKKSKREGIYVYIWVIHFTIQQKLTQASLVAQMAKNLPAVQETWVLSQVRKIPWRREWQSTPVFLPGEFHGQRSLAGCSPWGHKESDKTE